MKPFQSFAQEALLLMYSAAQKMSGVSAYMEVDNCRYIAERVSFHTKIQCMTRQMRTNDFVPKLHLTRFVLNVSSVTLSASGSHPTPHVSRIKAMGEAVERFSCFFPLSQVKNFRDSSTVGPLLKKGIRVKSLLGLRYKRIPYNEVFHALPRPKGTEEIFRENNTNGCASHPNKKTATVNALLELIERDAFLLHWLLKISPRKISFNPNVFKGPEVLHLLSMLPAYGIRYTFLDITTDIPVPACLCVVEKDSSTGTRYFVGAAAGFDFEAMVTSSLSEALSVLSFQFEAEPYVLPTSYMPFTDPRINKDERERVFFTEAMKPHISFLTSNAVSISSDDFLSLSGTLTFPPRDRTDVQYDHLKQLFAERYKTNTAWDVFVCPIKNKLTRELDIHVVRVLCKALLPLYLSEKNAAPAHPRIREFAQFKGLSDTTPLNPWPHPFP